MQQHFGVKRKELLSEAIKGEEYLNKLLNKGLDKTNESTNHNMTFKKICKSIDLFHYACDEKNKDTIYINKPNAIVKIFEFAEAGIEERISNMQTEDMNKFKEEFEQIKKDQLIIMHRITDRIPRKRKNEIRKELIPLYDSVDIRVRCIQAILDSDIIKNKPEFIHKLQEKQSIEEVNKFIYDNIIILDITKAVPSKTIIEEHNLEYSSYGKEWNNNKIIQYMKNNQKEMTKSYNTRKFGQGIINSFKKYIFNSKTKNEILLLEEKNEPSKAQKHSWDLSNWGIDKEQFMEKSANNIKNIKEKEEKTTEELTVDNNYEQI